jgi:methylenetetrahydrofolate reductase (NADPH)
MIDTLLAGTGFEVIPMKGALEKAQLLPPGAVVTVTASPAKGIDATLDLALTLRDLGYMAVPHLAARMITDRSQLAAIVKRLADGGIERIFVVGGDAEIPGDYHDALTLIRDLAEIGHPFTELGITGYPEGHPLISDELLLEALLAKQPYASYVATQMCFDARTIALWTSRMRTEGVTLPIKVGIPGAVDPARLLTIAARIGVGASARFLAKNRKAVFRLLRPGVFKPTKLVRSLAGYGDELGLAGLHIFTFNQVASTVAWYRQLQAKGR